MLDKIKAKPHNYEAAEREAEQLSQSFAQSTDIKRDVGRRLGLDFSSVKIHEGSTASAHADSLGAAAFTQGQNIYLGSDVEGESGMTRSQAVAHELVHTAQQTPGSGMNESVPSGSVQMIFGHARRKAKREAKAQSMVSERLAGAHSAVREQKLGEFTAAGHSLPARQDITQEGPWDSARMEADPAISALRIKLHPVLQKMSGFGYRRDDDLVEQHLGLSEEEQRAITNIEMQINMLEMNTHFMSKNTRELETLRAMLEETQSSRSIGKQKSVTIAAIQRKIEEVTARNEVNSDISAISDLNSPEAIAAANARNREQRQIQEDDMARTGVSPATAQGRRDQMQAEQAQAMRVRGHQTGFSQNLLRMYADPTLPVETLWDRPSGRGVLPDAFNDLDLQFDPVIREGLFGANEEAARFGSAYGPLNAAASQLGGRMAAPPGPALPRPPAHQMPPPAPRRGIQIPPPIQPPLPVPPAHQMPPPAPRRGIQLPPPIQPPLPVPPAHQMPPPAPRRGIQLPPPIPVPAGPPPGPAPRKAKPLPQLPRKAKPLPPLPKRS